MTMPNPTGFARATGVAKEHRTCTNKDCGRVFAVTVQQPTPCPACGAESMKLDKEH